MIRCTDVLQYNSDITIYYKHFLSPFLQNKLKSVKFKYK